MGMFGVALMDNAVQEALSRPEPVIKVAHVLSPLTFTTLCGADDGPAFVYSGIDDAARAIQLGTLPPVCRQCAYKIASAFRFLAETV
jgi:hypothetical protein